MTEALEIIYRFWWVIALYFVAVFSPFLTSIAYAFLHRRSLKRKALFVLSVASMSYGTPFVLYFFVCVPAWAAAVFLVPTLYATGHKDEPWVKAPVIIYDFVSTWWWIIVPAILLLWCTIVTTFLGRRWNAVASYPAVTIATAPGSTP